MMFQKVDQELKIRDCIMTSKTSLRNGYSIPEICSITLQWLDTRAESGTYAFLSTRTKC